MFVGGDSSELFFFFLRFMTVCVGRWDYSNKEQNETSAQLFPLYHKREERLRYSTEHTQQALR